MPSMIKRIATPARPAALASIAMALLLAACLFDKTREEVDLTLTHVPAGTERIRIIAVEKSDTSKQLGELHSQAWTGGPLHFALGKAQGKECFLRVEGYQDTFLVYLALIPPGKGDDQVFFPNVDAAWPGVVITSVVRTGDTLDIGTEFRNAPPNTYWELAPNSPLKGKPPRPGEKTLSSNAPVFHLAVPGLISDTYIITSLFDNATGMALPVQLRDTLLTDEALSPSGSTVEIVDATRIGDSVEIQLSVKNFSPPAKDEPVRAKGWPMAHDARGLRVLSEFHVKDGDMNRMAGPAWALDGVTTLVIALHYADGVRVRPLVSASVPVSTALLDRSSLPTVNIVSGQVVGTSLKFIVTSANLINGRHYHVFRDQMLATDYQLCRKDTCLVDSSVWVGAKRLIAAVVNEDHSLFVPVSRDTLLAPF
jgi:hypothetical protein